VSLRAEIDRYVDQELVTAKPNGPLTIYTYSTKCVMAGAWDYYTRLSRGLILDEAGNIVALPLEKFFNVNEREETLLHNLPKEIPELSVKHDGSLVIVFFDPYSDKWVCVTKGAWDNPQVRYATKFVHTRLRKEAMNPEWTYSFELVAPWNRIVLLYQNEDMILIGVRDRTTMWDASYSEVAAVATDIGVRSVEFWTDRTVETLDMANSEVRNAEGFVARYSNGKRIKFKYSQYLLMHAVVSNLSEKTVWEAVSTKSEIDFTAIPDEYYKWYLERKATLLSKKAELHRKVTASWMATPRFASRGQFAAHWKTMEPWVTACLFRRLDGKPYDEILWKQLRPSGLGEHFL